MTEVDTVELEAVMATVEMNLQLPTVPLPRADRRCGWCTRPLNRLNAEPREFEGKWFHPGGCYKAYRLRFYGFIPDTVQPWGPLL
jgi:hypothetical protein